MSLADRNLHKRIRYEVRKTLASVRMNVDSAIAKLTVYDAFSAGAKGRSPLFGTSMRQIVVLPDIFQDVDDAWAELNKLHTDLDEGKIKLG